MLTEFKILGPWIKSELLHFTVVPRIPYSIYIYIYIYLLQRLVK
jgi:hypothetical protein